MTQNDILLFLKENKTFLSDRYHVNKIGLFGSFARNEQTDQSDIDILFELDDQAKNIYDLKQDLRSYLSNAFHRSVDLAREKYIKPYALQAITKDAVYA